MGLKPIGPQPPVEPGWYWVEYPSPWRNTPAPTCYALIGKRLTRTDGGLFADIEVANGAVFQPVAKPEVCDD